MNWTTPGELRAQVQAWWDKGKILAELAGGEAVFPRRLTFITPSSGEIAEQFDAVRRWIQTLSTMPQVRFVERDFRHRLFGNNSLPSEAWIDSAEAAIALLGKRNDAANFRQMLATTASTQPTLLPWLQKRPLRALEHHANWQRLLAVVGWLQAHPRPGIYIRQVDLSDIDSKFIESQRALLGELLGDAYRNGEIALKVQPVIDLNNVPAADGYRPTRRMRKALRLLRPTEAFPFSTRTRRLDIDHNTTYQPGRPGQTRLDNLAQLCRRVHRSKTKGAWILNQITPGHFRWTSPLGYVYEVTSGGAWLECTPDLGPQLSPVDKTIQDWCDTIADAATLARCG